MHPFLIFSYLLPSFSDDADKSCLDEFPEWNPNKQPAKTEEEEAKKEESAKGKKNKKKKRKPKTELWYAL